VKLSHPVIQRGAKCITGGAVLVAVQGGELLARSSDKEDVNPDPDGGPVEYFCDAPDYGEPLRSFSPKDAAYYLDYPAALTEGHSCTQQGGKVAAVQNGKVLSSSDDVDYAQGDVEFYCDESSES
jgi:hypothetical protein